MEAKMNQSLRYDGIIYSFNNRNIFCLIFFPNVIEYTTKYIV